MGTATWGHLTRPPTTQHYPPQHHPSLGLARPGHLRTFARWPSFHLSRQPRVGSASGAACSTALLPRCRFLSNNITGGERSAELPPRLGLGCACKRQSPVSWLPVPSGPGQRSRSTDTTLPPPSPGSWATPGCLRGGGGGRAWMEICGGGSFSQLLTRLPSH